jgi:putative SOS response-associated peptidase YedK
LRWGLLPFWAKDLKSGASMINARIETVATKPAYRAAFKTRRCVLPMAGYYEWQDTPRGKQPYLITLRDGGSDLFAAGLWEPRHALQPENEDGSCTIITTTGVDAAGGIHDRMPVFVPPELIDRWMHATPEEAMALLVAIPTPDLALRPVTRRMSSYRFEDASILDPIAPAELLD